MSEEKEREPAAESVDESAGDSDSEGSTAAERIQERGERLLSTSAEVGREETVYSPLSSILDTIDPDETRILRLLATDGPQPVVDVRDVGYIPINSTLVAENLTMVGNDAGCRYPDRTPMYLENLTRLGLVRFSEESVDDLKGYQVLEAQPHVVNARQTVSRTTSDYGSLRLTALGTEFCETCLQLEVDTLRPAIRFRRED